MTYPYSYAPAPVLHPLESHMDPNPPEAFNGYTGQMVAVQQSNQGIDNNGLGASERKVAVA